MSKEPKLRNWLQIGLINFITSKIVSSYWELRGAMANKEIELKHHWLREISFAS